VGRGGNCSGVWADGQWPVGGWWAQSLHPQRRSCCSCIAVFPILADVVEVKKGSRSTAHWSNDFIRLNRWLRNSFAQLVTPLDIDSIGQNWEDSNIFSNDAHGQEEPRAHQRGGRRARAKIEERKTPLETATEPHQTGAWGGHQSHVFVRPVASSALQSRAP